MRRVLVLGGHGFLGRHVVAALDRSGYVVEVGPDRPDLDLAAAPVTRVAAMLRASRPGVVVTAAGLTTGSPTELLGHNAGVMECLVRACALAVPGVRLVHLGSAAEYGPTPWGHDVGESDPPAPAGPYGQAKLAATRILLEASDRGDVDGLVLRVFNPVGAGQPPSTLLGAIVRQLASAGPDADVVVGSLDAWRDFVPAVDIGTAVARAAGIRAVPERIVNLAEGRARQVRDVVNLLRDQAGHRGRLVERTGHEDAGDSARSAAVTWQRADVTLAARLLDWRVRCPLEVAVADALRPMPPVEGRG